MARWRVHQNDKNAPEIVGCAQSLGVFMERLDAPTDYLAWISGNWYLVEIKDPKKEDWKSEFTSKQKAFNERRPQGSVVLVWRTVEDVISHVNHIRSGER